MPKLNVLNTLGIITIKNKHVIIIFFDFSSKAFHALFKNGIIKYNPMYIPTYQPYGAALKEK